MQVNVGGQLDADSVVGRERLIAEIWEALRQQGVRLVAERRIGKTSVLRKMSTEQRDGMICFYLDVEDVNTPVQFASKIHKKCSNHLTVQTKLSTVVRQVLGFAAGGEVGGVISFPEGAGGSWRDLLSAVIGDLVDPKNKRTADQLVVLLLDELPQAIHNIGQTDRNLAIELLDALRELRQTHTDLRMVFAGSIGLGTVIKSLMQGKRRNEPVNDLRIIPVPPLDFNDATALADALLRGEKIVCTPTSELVAEAFARCTGGFAFYIQGAVAHVKSRGVALDAADVQGLVKAASLQAHDPWHLKHFSAKIMVDLEVPLSEYAETILGSLARDGPSSQTKLFEATRRQYAGAAQRDMRVALDYLIDELIVTTDGAGNFDIANKVLCEWWKERMQ